MTPRALAGLALALVGCAAGPRLAATTQHASPTPESTEVKLGFMLSELLSGGYAPYGDAKLASYVQRVGMRVARQSERPALPWRFIVSEDPEIGAQALPGGRVLISRNLLAYLEDEAELAAILGHEAAHVAFRHGNKVWDEPLPERSGSEASERDFALEEDEERQADTLAARYLKSAGYDPRAVARALEATERAALRECIRTRQQAGCERDLNDATDPHPPLPARIARVALAAGAGGGELGRERYLAALEGLHVGDPTDAPTLRGRRFGAPGSLSFELPAGCVAEARGGVLVSSSDPKLAVMRLRGELWPKLLRSVLESRPFTARQIAGQRALLGSMSPHNDARVALVDAPQAAYLLVVDGAGAGSQALLEALLASARREPSAGAHVPRIHVVRASEPRSLASLVASRCPDTPLELASALNRTPPDASVAKRRAVKCVSVR